MKRAAQLLARLYPASWKRRYGAEFDALLDDHSPTFRSLLNVLLGAFKMQLNNWNFVKIVTATAALGALATLAGSLTIPKAYRSTAVIRVSGSDSPQVLTHALLTLQQKVLSIRSLTKVIQASEVGQTFETMRKRIRVKPITAGEFSIEFDYADPSKAQRAVQLLVIALIDQGLIERIDSGSVARLDLLDPANLPEVPVSPNRLAFAGWGMLAGIGAGAIAYRFSSKRQPSQS